MSINPLAKKLNDELAVTVVSKLLSKRGTHAFFPTTGILGQSAQARGKAINATIGTAFEEDGSPLTLECLESMISLPSTSFLYAPSQGNPNLRAQWKTMLSQKNPGLVGKEFSLPVVSAALTHALYVAAYLFADEGDEIIIPDMYWDNYDLVFTESFGSTFLQYNTFKNGGFDTSALKAALNASKGPKKTVLLNFPNNPTGYTVTESEAIEICAILKQSAEAGNQILVLLDDAYFGLVYESGVAKESLFSTLADLHQNILVAKLDGPTKEDYVWSFRVGFMTFAFKGATAAQLAALEAKAAGVVRGTISNAPGISQELLLKAYQSADYAAQKQNKYDILQKRYTKIREILSAHPEYAQSFEPMPFNSGYFMCVKPNGVEAEVVRQELLNNYDTGVIVLSGLVRLAFSATPFNQLEPLFANLHAAIQKLKSE
jgi:aspartate/methionine/tyrosine aminotransferase